MAAWTRFSLMYLQWRLQKSCREPVLTSRSGLDGLLAYAASHAQPVYCAHGHCAHHTRGTRLESCVCEHAI